MFLLQSSIQNLQGITQAIVIALLVVIGIKIIDIFAEKAIRFRAEKQKSQSLDEKLIPWVRKIGKYVFLFIALLLILENFGYNITTLIAGLGLGGLAIAFAAQETIRDIFGGITIFANKSFYVGNKISVNGITGKVEEINLRTTRIRNEEERLVTIPNSKIASEAIENWSNAPGRKVSFALQLQYDTPPEKLEEVKSIIVNLLKHTQGIKQNTPQETFFRAWFSEFGASALKINGFYFVEDISHFHEIVDKINFSIKREFEEEGIEFAFPTQTFLLRNEGKKRVMQKISVKNNPRKENAQQAKMVSPKPKKVVVKENSLPKKESPARKPKKFATKPRAPSLSIIPKKELAKKERIPIPIKAKEENNLQEKMPKEIPKAEIKETPLPNGVPQRKKLIF